jgi:DNA processing protein
MDLHSAVALSVLPGISRVRAAAALKRLREWRGERLTLEQVIAVAAPAADVSAVADPARTEAARLLDAAAPAGVTALPWWDDRYPPLLRMIGDPPPVLWARGDFDVLTTPAVAIVGSRAATPYAMDAAARLAEDLAGHGLTVVSGLARGVDGAAHRGCIAGGGRTIAVLGSGPDVIYPSEHRKLAQDVPAHGAIVSELGPGAPPLPEHFPLRNRLISGISLAVVVVEASEKSGSLITAGCALEQGRDVMAVPGSILSGRNRGSHALLKDGAKVVEDAVDILEELGWPSGGCTPARNGKYLITDPLLDRMAPGEAYDLDALAGLFGLAGPDLLARMTAWELQGRVSRLPGGRFRRPVERVLT